VAVAAEAAGGQTLDDPIPSREPRVSAPVFDRRLLSPGLLGFPAPVDRLTSCWFWCGKGGIRRNDGVAEAVEPRVVGHRTQPLQGSVLITPHHPRRGERILAESSARCFFGDFDIASSREIFFRRLWIQSLVYKRGAADFSLYILFAECVRLAYTVLEMGSTLACANEEGIASVACTNTTLQYRQS
jgi:hypothetical protein